MGGPATNEEIQEGKKAVGAAGALLVLAIILTVLVPLVSGFVAYSGARGDEGIAFALGVGGGLLSALPILFAARLVYWSTKRRQSYMDRT